MNHHSQRDYLVSDHIPMSQAPSRIHSDQPRTISAPGHNHLDHTQGHTQARAQDAV